MNNPSIHSAIDAILLKSYLLSVKGQLDSAACNNNDVQLLLALIVNLNPLLKVAAMKHGAAIQANHKPSAESFLHDAEYLRSAMSWTYNLIRAADLNPAEMGLQDNEYEFLVRLGKLCDEVKGRYPGIEAA